MDRANGSRAETFNEAIQGQEDVAIGLSEDELDEFIHYEDPVSQSINSSPVEPSSKKTSTSKTRKRKMVEVVDVPTSLRDMNNNIATLMSGMNTHLSTMAQAMSDVSRREVAILNEEELVRKQKMDLPSELDRIPELSMDDAVLAAEKLASNTSNLALFYNSPSEVWRKKIVLRLIHPHSPRT